MLKEEWHKIKGFPNYLISNLGNVYNERIGRFMSTSHTWQGHVKVSLIDRDGTRRTMSVPRLVAQAFVEPPDRRCKQIVLLDGDLDNNLATNIVWRPYRFAWFYTRQLKEPHPVAYKNLRVHDITHNRYYKSVIETGMTEGLLFDDIWVSTYTGKIVYPIEAAFEIVKK